MKDSVIISTGTPYCPARGLLDKSVAKTEAEGSGLPDTRGDAEDSITSGLYLVLSTRI